MISAADFIALWLLCGYVGFVIVSHGIAEKTIRWFRIVMLCVSVACGPTMLLASLVLVAVIALHRWYTKSDSRLARWLKEEV